MSKTKSEQDPFGADRELYSGLIRPHVLHDAMEEPIFGLGLIEELARHGYKISPGSLYPLLHGLEQKGYLLSKEERNGESLRKLYRATPAGRKAHEAANKVRELFRELMKANRRFHSGIRYRDHADGGFVVTMAQGRSPARRAES
jgi:DNA-binding PadR family transcriptional regulator